MTNVVPLKKDEQPTGSLPALSCLEAEVELIGSLLTYDQSLPLVAEFLKPGHFTEPYLRQVYGYMLQLYQQGELPCGFSLFTHILAEFGEKETLAHCVAAAAPLIGMKAHANVIIDLAERRRLVEWTDVYKDLAEQDHEHRTRDLVAQAVHSITTDDVLGDQAQGRRTRYTAGEAGHVILEQVKALRAGTADRPQRAYPGSQALEKLIGGFRPGDLVIIAGRPSMGKTTIAQALTLKSAYKGHGVAYFSLEMGSGSLATRALSCLSFQSDRPIPYKDIEDGRVDNYQLERLVAAQATLSSLPYVIEEQAGLSMAQLRIMAQAIGQKLARDGRRLDIVVVDHLLLMSYMGGFKDKVQAFGQIPSQLKQLAKDMDCTVLALSQLNREAEGRESKRPQMSDLRWAGEIEQDADVVMFPFREHYYHKRSAPKDGQAKLDRADLLEATKHELELIVAKNRHGDTGSIEMFCAMEASYVRDKF